MAYKRKKPQASPVSFYLGETEKKKARVDKINELAASFGITRSVLLQKIADGELIVIKKV